VVFTGSFLFIAGLTMLTNPRDHIIFTVFFFASLLILFISFGYILTAYSGGSTPKRRYRVIIISVFTVILLMFRSSQSLDWVDGLILVLTVVGILFYADRRFTS